MIVSSVTFAQGLSRAHWGSMVRDVRRNSERMFETSAVEGSGNAATPPAATMASTSRISAVAADWSSLSHALQTGNLALAQAAFAKLAGDARSAVREHRRRDHGGQRGAEAVHAPREASPIHGVVQGTGNVVGTDLAALKEAVKSGNISSAQNLLVRLEREVRASGQARGHQNPRGFAPQNALTGYQSVAAIVTAQSSAVATPAAVDAAGAPTIDASATAAAPAGSAAAAV